MTKTSRKWRDKKLNKIRVYRKLHNSILGGITGVMAVIFLLTLCSDINRYTLTMFGVSVIWLGLVLYANEGKIKNDTR
jgi:uncharacterized membrane protein